MVLSELARSVLDARLRFPYPDLVQVRAIEAREITVFELCVEPSDLGKAIGRVGRNAKAIRTILNGWCEATKALDTRNP